MKKTKKFTGYFFYMVNLSLIILLFSGFTGCSREPIEYVDNEVVLYSVLDFSYYSEEEAAKVVFKSEDDFKIHIRAHFLDGTDDAPTDGVWHEKYVGDSKIKVIDIQNYIKDNYNIIKEDMGHTHNNMEYYRLVYNLPDGTIVTFYNSNSIRKKLSLSLSRCMTDKSEFSKCDTGELEYSRLYPAVYKWTFDDSEQIYDWYIEFCNGRYEDENFIFTYIRNDFKLVETNGEFSVEWVREVSQE